MRHLQERRDPKRNRHRHLERGGATVVIKDVPAEVCGNCSEYYLAEIEVLRYRPASARLR